MSTAKLEGTARERLLAAANELFYEEGVHTVGIDRVIERAGVAKASLYSSFGSKEELVRAYLAGRAESRQRRLSERFAQLADPRARILSVFDFLGELATQPQFRGCAFVNASAEGPREDNKISEVCSGTRHWLRELFTEQARALGVVDPERLGRQLTLLHDGASVTAAMDHSAQAVREARELAELLLDQQRPKRASHKPAR